MAVADRSRSRLCEVSCAADVHLTGISVHSQCGGVCSSSIAARSGHTCVRTNQYMMGMRTLIVDDEPVARQVLREELDQLDEVDIVGEASDGTSALHAIRELSPDLIFLDLQMPGVGRLRRHQETSFLAAVIPIVIIVTAFDQHAIQAFESGAIDYLLKPVRQDRLAQAVDRAIKLGIRPGASWRNNSRRCRSGGGFGTGAPGAENCGAQR